MAGLVSLAFSDGRTCGAIGGDYGRKYCGRSVSQTAEALEHAGPQGVAVLVGLRVLAAAGLVIVRSLHHHGASQPAQGTQGPTGQQG